MALANLKEALATIRARYIDISLSELNDKVLEKSGKRFP